MKNIYGLKGIKTLVIVTHNLDLLNACDRIYEIKEKKLVKIKN